MFHKDGPSFRELLEQALSGTAKGYDMLAPKFEATPFCTPEDLIAKALRDLGDVRDAIDLCCGTGTAFGPLRQMVSDRIVGVDFSEGMLEHARKKTNALSGPPRMELVQGDVLELDYRERFDIATCFGALGHIPDHEEPRFLNVIRRALRKGGRFVFLTTDEPPLWSRQKLVGEAFNAVMRVRNLVIKPEFVMYYLTFLLPDIERHLKWYGFDVAVSRDLFGGPFKSVARVVATKR